MCVHKHQHQHHRRVPPVFNTNHRIRILQTIMLLLSMSLLLVFITIFKSRSHAIIVQSLVVFYHRGLAINYNATHCDKLHLFFFSSFCSVTPALDEMCSEQCLILASSRHVINFIRFRALP